MDTAKVASFSVANPGNIENYLGRGLIRYRGLPLICIPTTSGTGSEITVSAVFSVGNMKRFFASPHIVPDAAIVDPSLTVSLPPKATAGSGLDALSHAIEGIISLNSTSLTQAIGLEAIKLISNNIRRAYYNGRDLEARYNMSFAATMAGLSFSEPGVIHGHSIAQTFGPIYNVPHGLSCAMTLPFIMEFYKSAVPDKLSKIAESLGVDTTRLTDSEASEAAIHTVHEINEDLEIPSLKSVGADRKDFMKIAKDCVKSWVRPNSPKQLTEKAVIQILERCGHKTQTNPDFFKQGFVRGFSIYPNMKYGIERKRFLVRYLLSQSTSSSSSSSHAVVSSAVALSLYMRRRRGMTSLTASLLEIWHLMATFAATAWSFRRLW